jgi:hypothetical protein
MKKRDQFLLEEAYKKVINEQATSFGAVFPSVYMLTSRDVKTQPLMGGTNNTNIIYGLLIRTIKMYVFSSLFQEQERFKI